jgi:hypothetical protein
LPSHLSQHGVVVSLQQVFSAFVFVVADIASVESFLQQDSFFTFLHLSQHLFSNVHVSEHLSQHGFLQHSFLLLEQSPSFLQEFLHEVSVSIINIITIRMVNIDFIFFIILFFN